MDPVHEPAEQGTDEMRRGIDCTRSAMADKMGALEDQMMGTVQSAQETVDDSIQMARDTVATVKRNFDIKYQVEQHPWVMVGGCFLVGLALGSRVLGAGRRSRKAPERLVGNAMPPAESPRFVAEQRRNDSGTIAAPLPQPESLPANRPGLLGQFHEEIAMVKGMAIGYVMGLVRDSMKEAVPRLASQIGEVMNSVTTKLGSKPVQQRSP